MGATEEVGAIRAWVLLLPHVGVRDMLLSDTQKLL